MPVIARIADDFPIDGVTIFVAHRTSDSDLARTEQILSFETAPPQWQRYEPSALAARTEVGLRIPEDAARAIYDALGRYFHGHEDTRALRRDFDHEKDRRDYLEGVIAITLDKLATAPPPVPLAEVRSFDPTR